MPPIAPRAIVSLLETQRRPISQIPRAASKGPRICSRPISAFGYYQAKSLVYSRHGSIPDVLDLHTHSIPPPHSSLLTLRTLSSPLNPADINQIQGTYPSAPPFTNSLSTPSPSAVPGNEACFEVVATGSAIKSVKKGDWVIPRSTGLGTWRTHLQVNEDAVIRVDKDGLTHAQVATVSVNPVTAWRMLKDFVRLGEGDWFVQNGANSGVGRAAIQFGKLWGLNSIAVVRDRPESERESLRKELEELGATKVVFDNEVQKKGFSDSVREWTKGREVQLGLNCVGGNQATEIATKILSPGARLVTYGNMSRAAMKLGAGPLIFQDLTFSGFWVSRWGDSHPDEKIRTIEEILALIRDGKFKDTPFEEVDWKWDTKKEELVKAVKGTLEGYRKGKGIFVFEDTGD